MKKEKKNLGQESTPNEQVQPQKSENKSIFRITAYVLCAVLIVAIFVQAVVLIALKCKKDDLEQKNSQIPSVAQLVEQPNQPLDKIVVDKSGNISTSNKI